MKMNKIKNKKVYIIIAAAVLMAVIFVIVRSNLVKSSDVDDNMEITEETATAEIMTIEKKVSSKGEVKSALEENLIPHTGWKFKETNAVRGERIREGETILTYTNGNVMVAPYDLVIKEWDLPNKNGTFVNDNSVSVAGTHVLKMDVNVNEDKILDVYKGNPATISIKATGKKYNGNVSFVSDVGEYSDGLSEFTVSVNFDNDGIVKLGMNGNVKITLEKAENVLTVPVAAVYNDGDKDYVTVKKEEANAEIEVKTGISDDVNIEIKKGLKQGDEVILMPSDEEEIYEY